MGKPVQLDRLNEVLTFLEPQAMSRLGPVALEADTVARLVFALPDGGPPLEVVSILVRTDPDGCAFTFVRLGLTEAERLRELLRSAPGSRQP